jgi:hypothetical protein
MLHFPTLCFSHILTFSLSHFLTFSLSRRSVLAFGDNDPEDDVHQRTGESRLTGPTPTRTARARWSHPCQRSQPVLNTRRRSGDFEYYVSTAEIRPCLSSLSKSAQSKGPKLNDPLPVPDLRTFSLSHLRTFAPSPPRPLAPRPLSRSYVRILSLSHLLTFSPSHLLTFSLSHLLTLPTRRSAVHAPGDPPRRMPPPCRRWLRDPSAPKPASRFRPRRSGRWRLRPLPRPA